MPALHKLWLRNASGLKPQRLIIPGQGGVGGSCQRSTGNFNTHRRDSTSPARPADGESDSVRSGLAELAAVLIEIELPTGVMRLPLDSDPEIAAARTNVDVCRDFITSELPAATRDVGETVAGPTFQALLEHGCWDLDQAVDSGGSVVAAAAAVGDGDGAGARQKNSSTSSLQMYVVREDRAVGASINLLEIPGGAPRADKLASKAKMLVEMLRIKIEDDGDLGQASKTLRDIASFFEKLTAACRKQGITEADGLKKLRTL